MWFAPHHSCQNMVGLCPWATLHRELHENQFHTFTFLYTINVQRDVSETALSFQFHILHSFIGEKKHLIIISPISPFCNMLNTWWLCVILNITQYHSISHAFCRQTINGLLSLLIGRVICCDIQYHTISRWVSDNWINRDIVILIS